MSAVHPVSHSKKRTPDSEEPGLKANVIDADRPRECRRPNVGIRVQTLKEVIHPHLPVRVPCYDLVPLTPLTFGRSFPCGLGHGLRVKTIQVT